MNPRAAMTIKKRRRMVMWGKNVEGWRETRVIVRYLGPQDCNRSVRCDVPQDFTPPPACGIPKAMKGFIPYYSIMIRVLRSHTYSQFQEYSPYSGSKILIHCFRTQCPPFFPPSFLFFLGPKLNFLCPKSIFFFSVLQFHKKKRK